MEDKSRKDKDESDRLTECSSYEALPGRKVFIGDPLLVKFSTKVAVSSKNTTEEIEEN